MHEFSLTARLLEEVTRHARSFKGSRLSLIEVDVGQFSGVEPLLLETAFAQLKDATVAETATLRVNTVPLLLRCEACGQTSAPTTVSFRCTHCFANRVEILDGEGVYLRRMAFESPDTGMAESCSSTSQ